MCGRQEGEEEGNEGRREGEKEVKEVQFYFLWVKMFLHSLKTKCSL